MKAETFSFVKDTSLQVVTFFFTCQGHLVVASINPGCGVRYPAVHFPLPNLLLCNEALYIKQIQGIAWEIGRFKLLLGVHRVPAPT